MSDTKRGGAGVPPSEPGLVPEADEIIGQHSAPEAQTGDPRVAELEAELADKNDQLLRAVAEMENVRRRAQRDVKEARDFAVTRFARDLLNVSDNFQRALQTVNGMDADTLPDQLRGLMDGVRMTERELAATLERHGVAFDDPTGERFDPNRHQAMFEVDDPSVPAGTVVQVVQSGANLGGRVLRPAMVGVAKGGPKPGAPSGEPAAAPAEGSAG